MEWTQEQIGAAVAAGVPLAGTVVGMVVALVNWTKEARLKRRAEMLRAEIATATLPNDTAVLHSLHRSTTARIVAHAAVPTSKMAGQALVILCAMMFPLAAGFLGTIALGLYVSGVPNIDAGAQRTWMFIAAAGALAGLIYTAGLRLPIVELLKLNLERRRMEALYLSGRGLDRSMSRSSGLPSVDSLEPLSDHAKNTAVRIRRRLRVVTWGATLMFGILALCYGVLLAGVLLDLEVNTLVLLYFTPLVLIFLFVDLIIMVPVIANGLNAGPDEWIHPRPPSTEQQIQAESASVHRPKTPLRRTRGRWSFRRFRGRPERAADVVPR